MNKIMRQLGITHTALEDYIKALPPSSVNNSREILRKLVDKYNKTKNQHLMRQIEEITGIPCDEPSWADTSNNEQNHE